MAGEIQVIGARLIPFKQTLAWYTANNPVPLDGELFIELSTPRKAKIGDGITAYISLPYFAGIVGTTGSLQDVLNTGNTAVLSGPDIADFSLSDTVYKTSYQGSDITLQAIAGLVTLAQILDAGGSNGALKLGNATGSGQISSVGLTGSRSYRLPDEGIGAGTDDIIVLHKTKDPIKVETAAPLTTIINAGTILCGQVAPAQNSISIDGTNGNVVVKNNITVCASLLGAGNQGQIQLRSLGTVLNITTVPMSPITANRTQTQKNRTGDIMIDCTFNNTQALVAAATMVMPFVVVGAAPTKIVGITPLDAGAAAAWVGAFANIVGATVVITFAAPVTANCTFDFSLT